MNNSNYTIFLDMDGVLADFVTGACQAHGRPNPYNDPANYANFNMEQIWGITTEQFYAPVMYPGFWAGLRPTPEALYLVELAKATVGIPNIGILTSPNRDPNCIGEKEQWMLDRHPEVSSHMIFARSFVKRLVARPNAILIDDYDRNIDQWRAAGGLGILVPRLWNREWELALHGSTLSRIESQLHAILGSDYAVA